jgi:hypothetical protein
VARWLSTPQGDRLLPDEPVDPDKARKVRLRWLDDPEAITYRRIAAEREAGGDEVPSANTAALPLTPHEAETQQVNA